MILAKIILCHCHYYWGGGGGRLRKLLRWALGRKRLRTTALKGERPIDLLPNILTTTPKNVKLNYKYN